MKWIGAGGLCLAAGLGSGCRHDVDERLGLDEKRAAQPLDPAKLAREGELEKAVGSPAADVATHLKSWRLSETATLQLSSGETKDTLEESWKLEVDAKGATHVTTENSHGNGVETVVVDGGVFVKPRYGRFLRHTPEGEEIERTRDGVEGVLASYLSVLGRFADRKDLGDGEVGGRKARRIQLSLASSPSRLRDPEPAHAWRKTMRVSELSGEVDVDVESGAPLHATLEAAWSAEQPGSMNGDQKAAEVAVKLSFRADLDQVGAVPAIGAPEGALLSAMRTRPLLDRQALLDGLVAGGGGVPAGER